MRLSEVAATPILSSYLNNLLNKIATSRMSPACLVQRAKIILYASEGIHNKEIAVEVGLHPTNVGKWRTRFLHEMERLYTIEQEDPEKLLDEVSKILTDAPRSGAKPIYTADQQAYIITIACQNPSDHGFELSHWNLSSLRLAVIKKGIVSNISVATIGRILKENEIQPHKNQYWLHSTDKAEKPEIYREKIKNINAAYARAHQIAISGENSSVRILSTDEMTGIQALERKFPDKLPKCGMAPKQEFEYIRHGTASLTAFFDVVQGTVEDPYINSTRTEIDFVKALDAIVQKSPDGEFIIVADNLNTHYSASLVEYISEAIGDETELGQKGICGILKNKESRIKYLSDASHRIRFLYTPKHCSWMNQIEIWFGIINRQLLKRKSYCSVDELIDSIKTFVRQYNELFSHPFDWNYNTTPVGD